MSDNLNEKALTAAVASGGYEKVLRQTYKLSESNRDVEHLLFFSTFKQNGELLLTADFGVRNLCAQNFSRDMILQYGGSLFQTLHETIISNQCFMRFSVWRFVGNVIRSYWRANDHNLSHDIQSTIFPQLTDFVSSVRTKEDLFLLLSGDEELCPWVVVNGAIRAAQIAMLAADTEREPSFVLKILSTKKQLISNNISSEVNVDDFVGAVLTNAWSKTRTGKS